MSMRLSQVLKRSVDPDAVTSSVESHEGGYSRGSGDDQERRATHYTDFVSNYYKLVTDFYVLGWGESFHFAPRSQGESFAASVARHQHYVAHMLSLRPGMRVADLGCGVGGPLRSIARFSGAQILGVNISAYQIERARRKTAEAGLDHLASFVEADFTDVKEPDGSFDAIYAIEATTHAPDRAAVFAEALRLLKPGGRFISYEWCMTDRFDAANPDHLRIKNDIEVGAATQEIISTHAVDAAMRDVGFELLEARDLAEQTGSSIPWYEPLVGSAVSLKTFRSSGPGRATTHHSLRLLEALRAVPRGTTLVSSLLERAATGCAEAGRLGIFTPMYCVLGHKPA